MKPSASDLHSTSGKSFPTVPNNKILLGAKFQPQQKRIKRKRPGRVWGINKMGTDAKNETGVDPEEEGSGGALHVWVVEENRGWISKREGGQMKVKNPGERKSPNITTH